MTAREKLRDKGFNLNSGLLIGGALIPMVGGIWVVAKFLVPLEDMPAEVADLKRNQVVQTEALKTLADVAADTKETRSEVIRHDTEIREVKRRLDRLESR